MISFKPFFNILLRLDITEYELVHTYKVSSNTIHRMRHNLPITTKTIDNLCFILNCEVSDIMCHDKFVDIDIDK